MPEPINFGRTPPTWGTPQPTPGATPEIVTAGGERAITEMTLLAEQAFALAKASDTAERRVSTFIDTMRRWGANWGEVNVAIRARLPNESALLKITKDGTEQLKRLAPENRLSWKKLQEMPISEIGKNFTGVARSMMSLGRPALTVATVLKGVKYSLEQVAIATQNVSAFAGAGGAYAGGFEETMKTFRSRKERDRAETLRMGAVLDYIGLKDDEQKQAFGKVAQAVPEVIRGEAGPALTAVIAGLGHNLKTGFDPPLQMISEMARMGVPLENMRGTVVGFKDDFKKVPTQELTRGFLDLYRNSRIYGTGLESAVGGVKAWIDAVSAGTTTFKEISQTVSGGLNRSFVDYIKMVDIADQTGSKVFQDLVKGGSREERAERLFKLSMTAEGAKKIGEAVGDVMRRGGPTMGLGAGPIGVKAFAEMTSSEKFMPTRASLARAVFGPEYEEPKLPEAFGAEKVRKEFGDMVKAAATMARDERGLTLGGFSAMSNAMGKLTLAYVEEARKLAMGTEAARNKRSSEEVQVLGMNENMTTLLMQ